MTTFQSLPIREFGKVSLFLILALTASFMTGCATVTRGTTEQLIVQSELTGATVRPSNGFTGVTPATVTTPRKGELGLSFSRQGYENSEVAVASRLSGTATASLVGNALLGEVISVKTRRGK